MTTPRSSTTDDEPRDLSAQLAVSRDLVQTFCEALGLLTDEDLQMPPGGSGLRPKVDGTPDPPTPYQGDRGVRGWVMRALRDAHLAAVALCAVDVCDDPMPWERPPDIDRSGLPVLVDCRRHLRALDGALADVQHGMHQLVFADRVQALRACDLIRQPGASGKARTISHPSWEQMARRAREQCQHCHRPSGSSWLCEQCQGDGYRCKGAPGVVCDRWINERTYCDRCRKRLSRMSHADVREAVTDTLTTRCRGCGWQATVAVGAGTPESCARCEEAVAS